jgi:hypothetical protein
MIKPTLHTQSRCLLQWYRRADGEVVYIRDHGNGHSSEYELVDNGVVVRSMAECCLLEAHSFDDFRGYVLDLVEFE